MSTNCSHLDTFVTLLPFEPDASLDGSSEDLEQLKDLAREASSRLAPSEVEFTYYQLPKILIWRVGSIQPDAMRQGIVSGLRDLWGGVDLSPEDPALVQISSESALSSAVSEYEWDKGYIGYDRYLAACGDEGSEKPVIAVLGTGVEIKHTDFAPVDHSKPRVIADETVPFRGNLLNGLDTQDLPTDRQGHGTAVASIALGVQSGIARRARLMRVKFASGLVASSELLAGAVVVAAGSGAYVWRMDVSGDVSEAVHPPAKEAADIILITATTSRDPVRHLPRALDWAASQGKLIVYAAGNDPSEAKVKFPKPKQNGIAVGALSAINSHAYPSIFSNNSNEVNIFAPGDGIVAAALASSGGVLDRHQLVSGTSFAAPLVAGAIALTWRTHGGADLSKILSAISAPLQAVPGKPAPGKGMRLHLNAC